MKDREALDEAIDIDSILSTQICSIRLTINRLAGELTTIADIFAGQKSHRLQTRLLDINRQLIHSVAHCNCTYPRISKIKTIMRVKTALLECQDCLILAKILGLHDTSLQLSELARLQRNIENVCKC
ncbi:MAG: hypothetical protein ACM3U1_01830 [Chloroflexota bacterium]